MEPVPKRIARAVASRRLRNLQFVRLKGSGARNFLSSHQNYMARTSNRKGDLLVTLVFDPEDGDGESFLVEAENVDEFVASVRNALTRLGR